LRYSVLLPAHRDDAYLIEAVRSVEAAMGEDDAELIVIANGKSREAIAARLALEPPSLRRRLITTELPSLVHALNLGIEAARGDLIARMDSDDICLPDRFAIQLAYADSHKVDFLFTEVEYVDGQGRPLPRGPNRWARHPDLDFPLFHPTAMIRRQALIHLGGYGNLAFAEDRHLWLSARRLAFKFDKLPQPTIRYRLHENQQTGDLNKHATIAVSIGVDVGFGLRDGRPSLVLHGLFNTGVLIYTALKRWTKRALARGKGEPASDAFGLKPGQEAARGGRRVLEGTDQLVPQVNGQGVSADDGLEVDGRVGDPASVVVRRRI
jgi:glycosyltransferase involved in cell wall biosynthesis